MLFCHVLCGDPDLQLWKILGMAEEAKEEAERARKIAQEANRAKSDFLASMSHEIRTPINAVLGMDEMILRESTNPKILGYASDIKQAGSMLLSLINDILDFSKIESGKMDIIPVGYDLAILLSDTVDMIRSRAEEKKLQLALKNENNVSYVRENHEEFMAAYERVVSEVKTYIERANTV